MAGLPGMLVAAPRNLALAVALCALIAFVRPVLEHSVYLGRLLALPPPKDLPQPLGSPRARMHDSWHASRSGGRRHEGVDIFAPRGTPVRSTTEGLILRRGSNRLGGKVVWVLGPGGHRHYYAHLDAYAHVRSGERIQPGAVLGYVGDSGNAKGTPPHLHYGIYTPSGPINPYPLLAAGRVNDARSPRPGGKP
ncbi:M23 family metallopeptidase [Noviherbaspirillum aridicola]|uniref:Peptidase M23 n=1 Tax=Noviherbaspirillum aridicola TaxID=2849687 RepID=A0ABQ4PZY3_9BURK|nr:M23 family metallopeptidase [Noviherbaspirillum aridicola]GIZ50409.1 peptidase M23 [Noviherbaspirillum aridicola]